jgi:AcrR family transcriptional regulator
MTSGTERRDEKNAQRILHVAERLFARRGYRHVTVRDIAEGAHVTHPLIYHYFGSKRGLFAAVLEKNQGRMRAVAERSEGVEETIRDLSRASLTHARSYQLILARAFAEGMSTRDWPGGFPGAETAVARLIAALPPDHGAAEEEDVRESVAVAVALLHGWILEEDHLLEIVGLPAERRGALRERVVETMVRLVLPRSSGD